MLTTAATAVDALRAERLAQLIEAWENDPGRRDVAAVGARWDDAVGQALRNLAEGFLTGATPSASITWMVATPSPVVTFAAPHCFCPELPSAPVPAVPVVAPITTYPIMPGRGRAVHV